MLFFALFFYSCCSTLQKKVHRPNKSFKKTTFQLLNGSLLHNTQRFGSRTEAEMLFLLPFYLVSVRPFFHNVSSRPNSFSLNSQVEVHCSFQGDRSKQFYNKLFYWLLQNAFSAVPIRYYCKMTDFQSLFSKSCRLATEIPVAIQEHSPNISTNAFLLHISLLQLHSDVPSQHTCKTKSASLIDIV